MAIFPVTEPIQITPETVITNERGIEFLFDFNKNDFPVKNGNLIKLDGTAAVLFWIEKTLRTEYEKARVYKNTEYGTILESLVGKTMPKNLAKLNLENNIKSSLLKHERILSINNFTLEKEKDLVNIGFEIEIAPLKRKSYEGTVVDFNEFQSFFKIKLIDSNRFYFKTNLGEQIYLEV